jgi:hypothetical protein
MSSFRLLTEDISALHKDLLAFRARTEQWFDKIDGRFGRMDARLDRIDSHLRRLRRDMPRIIAKAVRAAHSK